MTCSKINDFSRKIKNTNKKENKNRHYVYGKQWAPIMSELGAPDKKKGRTAGLIRRTTHDPDKETNKPERDKDKGSPPKNPKDSKREEKPKRYVNEKTFVNLVLVTRISKPIPKKKVQKLVLEEAAHGSPWLLKLIKVIEKNSF